MNIVVNSCWSYRDAWGPFMGLFQKFWPNREYSIILVTEREENLFEGDLVYESTHDRGWCGNLWKCMDELLEPNEHILLLQEDFFFTQEVDKSFIKYACGKVEEDSNLGCFRLYPCPGPLDESSFLPGYSEDVGLICREEPYRISCQAAIWRHSYLKTLLKDFYLPSEFELKGTYFSQNLEEYVVSVKRKRKPWPLEYLCSAISRGQWNPDAITLCRKHGIPIDTSLRPIQGR